MKLDDYVAMKRKNHPEVFRIIRKHGGEIAEKQLVILIASMIRDGIAHDKEQADKRQRNWEQFLDNKYNEEMAEAYRYGSPRGGN